MCVYRQAVAWYVKAAAIAEVPAASSTPARAAACTSVINVNKY